MSSQYVPPSEDQEKLIQTFRDKFEALQKEIDESVDHSRGKSLCFTKLEEVGFWLNKAIMKND